MDEDSTEWKNLPVDEKCTHKSWKARSEGYEAASRLFQCIDDDKSPEWSKYAGLLKKFITDSNLTAQEKGLNAVLAYVENYVHAGKTVGEVMSNLVQKCIGSSAKPKTKELAVQISLMYIEIEKYEIVVEELLKGTESKNPKTSCGCLTILIQALREFGPKVVGISKILKKMPTALTDRDKNVRGEARGLVVEIYRWVGAPIKTQLSSLKSAQMTELEAEFDKLSGPPPVPTRLLRSQQAKKAVQVSGDKTMDAGGDVQDEADGENEIDATELMEPVDVLSKLPKKFFEQLEEKKWTERRDALDLLEKELKAAPRLEPVDYGDLVKALKRIISKDSNIVVIALALKCLTGLASGLKKKFLPYVGALMPTLLDKFKEKKQNVVTALRETVDAIFLVSHLESISEDIVSALDNKNPCIKNEVSLFLARCFTRCTPAILNKKLLKVLSSSLLKVLNDSDPGARDAAASALGTAMKVVGEKGIAPFLADIGDQKMTKIKACCETAELQKPIRVASAEVKSDRPSSKQPTGKTAARPTSKVVRPLKKDSSTSKSQPKSASSNLAKTLSNKIPVEIVNNLNSSDGNKQLQAYEELVKFFENNEIPSESIPAVFDLLHTFEDNPNVVEVKINCMKTIAEKMDLSNLELKTSILALLKKYNDPKFNDCVSGCLASISKSCGNDQFVQSILHPTVTTDKNLWDTSLKWISEGIINYNLTFSEEFLQREAQKAIKSGNFTLRNAGLAMIGTLHMMNKDTDCPAPSSSLSAPTQHTNQSTLKADNAKKSKGSDVPSPKTSVDISTIITAAVLNELSDDSWKTRLDSLDRIKPLIESAGPINPNLGEVQNTFEILLTDKNTKVVQSALTCLAVLIKGLGVHSRKFTCFFLPKVLKNISDPKVWVRNCVLMVLDAIGSSGGYKELFDNDTIADVCASITLPAAKVELFTWIIQTLNRVDSVPTEGLVAMLPVVYQSLEDRNADIRKASNEAIITFMMHLGYDTMLNGCSNLKGSTAATVKSLLDKNRGNIPEPPEPTVSRSKSASQLKKMSAGSSATFTKPTKGTTKSNIGARSVAVSKRDDQERCDGPLLEKNNMKNQRVLDEQKMRTIKWQFTTPRPEFIELLKDLMNVANVNPNLIVNMFHSDFKFHIKAIDSLAEDLSVNPEGTIANLDLILRWMTLRFFDTNPSVLIKGLEYLVNVFNVLIEEGYNMLDMEGTSFLPYLLLKAGDAKDTVKNLVRTIVRQTAQVYSRQKLFGIVLEGLKSKSARLRAELLEILSYMISTYNIEVCSPNVVSALKEISRHISDKDMSVRNGALNCMVAVYYLVGDNLYKYVGTLPNLPNGLLEERLKRALKNRPVASIKPLETPPKERNVQNREMDNDETFRSEEADNEIEYNMEDGSTFVISPTVSPPTYQLMTGANQCSNINSVEANDRMDCMEDEVERTLASSPHISPASHHQLNTVITQPIISFDNVNWDQVDFAKIGPEIEKLVTAEHRLDHRFYEPLPTFTMPEISTPDLSFLDSPVKPLCLFDFPTTSKAATAANLSNDPVIKELNNPDLEKAIMAMAKIETILYSDKAYTLRPKIDCLISQLEQQLVILNHSDHPDVVNCYRGNFALILKLLDYEQLCEDISEPNLSRLIKQLLLLLTENRLEKIGQELFVKTVNNLVLRLLESCNKTTVLSSLIKILHETIRPVTSKQYQDLVMKCLWKVNRAQPAWDQHLNYPKILSDINNFFVEFPMSYWRTQERDVPIKTIKTIVHSMVKIRGTRVRDELDKVPGIQPDSEIASYIRKVIRHLELESKKQSKANNNASDAPQTETKAERMGADEHVQTHDQELIKELKAILSPFVNSNESPESLRRLYDFKKKNPSLDINNYLIELPTLSICYIKKGLANLELKDMGGPSVSNLTHNQTTPIQLMTRNDPQLEYYRKQLEYWNQWLNSK